MQERAERHAHARDNTIGHPRNGAQHALCQQTTKKRLQ
jgi:hypothetical protein